MLDEDFDRALVLLRDGLKDASIEAVSDTTDDRFLGGRVKVRQPLRGFRAGLDAVMLAAAVPADRGEERSGTGRGRGHGEPVPGGADRKISMSAGIEIDPALVKLANANAAENGMDARVSFVAGDALAPPEELRQQFDHVFCNPPFHGEENQSSPDEGRALALHDDEVHLAEWFAAGLKRTAPGGTLRSSCAPTG